MQTDTSRLTSGTEDVHHFTFFRPTGHREQVEKACTCGQRHGLCTWPNIEMALGSLDPAQLHAVATRSEINEFSRVAARALLAVRGTYANHPAADNRVRRNGGA